MAAKSWYLTATTGNSWRTIDEATQTAATNADGWVVGTGNTNQSAYYVGVERAASTFADATPPDGSLDTTNFDAFRTTNAYTGSFANANWTFDFVGRAVSSATGHQGACVIRLFRSANANGSSATEITAAQQTGTTCAAMNATGTDYTSTVTFNPGAFSVNNEYIFIQIGWKRITAASMTTADWNWRTGSASNTGTRIVSSDFSVTVSGTFGITEGLDATSTVTDVLLAGVFNKTEVLDATTTDGDVSVQGTAGVTEAIDATTTDTDVIVGGTTSVTEVLDTLSSTGEVTSAPVVGTASITEAVDTTMTDADIVLVGTSSITEAVDTTTTDADVVLIGTASFIEALNTLSATGGTELAVVNGDANTFEVADLLNTDGAVLCVGTADLADIADFLAADGMVFSGVSGNASVVGELDFLTASGLVLGINPMPFELESFVALDITEAIFVMADSNEVVFQQPE